MELATFFFTLTFSTVALLEKDSTREGYRGTYLTVILVQYPIQISKVFSDNILKLDSLVYSLRSSRHHM